MGAFTMSLIIRLLIFCCVLTAHAMEQGSSGAQDYQFRQPGKPLWKCFTCKGHFFLEKKSALEHKKLTHHNVTLNNKVPKQCMGICGECYTYMVHFADIATHNEHYPHHSVFQPAELDNTFHCDTCKITFIQSVHMIKHMKQEPNHTFSIR
jgi:hypothetical protein